jgi:alpha-1,6-mannosyltransferase
VPRSLAHRPRPVTSPDASRPLRVVDVAVWYGARSGGIRTYLDAKSRVAAETGSFEHHLVIPSAQEHHEDGRHELPGVVVSRANGYRLPLDAGPLLATLRAIKPDVVLVHDPYWRPGSVVRCAQHLGSLLIAVHHGTAAAGAIGKPGPQRVWRAGLSAWERRLYRRVDAVMAYGRPPAEAEGVPLLPLRHGVDPAFRPPQSPARADHVLYAGRLSPEKGVDLLLEAMAESAWPWPLRLVGRGPAEGTLRRRVARMGLQRRVSFAPFIADPGALCRAYAEAACVVVPGSHETFGLVAIEAAASGATVVASDAVPSTRHAVGLVHAFPADDAGALAATIERVSRSDPNATAARALGRRLTWERAIAAELRDLEGLSR